MAQMSLLGGAGGGGGLCRDSGEAEGYTEWTTYHLHLDCVLTYNIDTRSCDPDIGDGNAEGKVRVWEIEVGLREALRACVCTNVCAYECLYVPLLQVVRC